jgi:hypothetical protein
VPAVRLLAILALAALASPALAAPRSPAVAKGVHLYEYGDYESATQVLVSALAGGIPEQEDRTAARTYLAAALYAQNDAGRSRKVLRSLLAEDRGAVAEATAFPPRFVELFDETRRELGIPAPGLAKTPPKLTLDGPPKDRASLGVTLVPFGVGQFAEGSPGKGAVFLGGELLAFGTFAVSLSAFEAKKVDGSFLGGGTFDDPAGARRLQTIYLVSFWSGVAIAAVGVADAVLNR